MIPSNCHWGVNSLVVAHQPLPFLPGQKTLFEYVKEKAGETPSFWGRYIGPSNPNYPLLGPLTKDEADFIFKRSEKTCRVFPIFNGLTNSPHSVQGQLVQGKTDALAAVNAAKTAGVPTLSD
jgi:hypothetical protein